MTQIRTHGIWRLLRRHPTAADLRGIEGSVASAQQLRGYPLPLGARTTCEVRKAPPSGPQVVKPQARLVGVGHSQAHAAVDSNFIRSRRMLPCSR